MEAPSAHYGEAAPDITGGPAADPRTVTAERRQAGAAGEHGVVGHADRSVHLDGVPVAGLAVQHGGPADADSLVAEAERPAAGGPAHIAFLQPLDFVERACRCSSASSRDSWISCMSSS
jgi:hypothetical protein